MTNRDIWMPYILHCLYNGNAAIARMHVEHYLAQVRRGK